MSISGTETAEAVAQTSEVDDDSLVAHLIDGRTISAPLAWFPRLLHGTPEERSNWRLIGNSVGIHWPELDEDISIAGCWPAANRVSPESLKRWLKSRVS